MSGAQPPLISIITPSYNQAPYIEETIQSVWTQDYRPIEHIVVDGGSTDGTLDILRRYEDRLTWTSEPDEGQADAINKGFRRATGGIFAWLNSDDVLMPGALAKVAAFFEANPHISFVYGDAEAIDERGQSYGRRAHVKPCNFDMLLREGDFIVQPAAFWRADLWRAVGELDPQWRYVLDYDLWIRAAKRCEMAYMPHTLAKERIYGSAKTFSGGLERIRELETMPQRYGGSGVPFGFRPEAVAVYLNDAWTAFRKGQRTEARGLLRSAARCFRLEGARGFPPLNALRFIVKLVMYLSTFLLFGEAGVPRSRLLSNRIRLLYKRRPAETP